MIDLTTKICISVTVLANPIAGSVVVVLSGCCYFGGGYRDLFGIFRPIERREAEVVESLAKVAKGRLSEGGQATIDLVIAFSALWLSVVAIIQFGLWGGSTPPTCCRLLLRKGLAPPGQRQEVRKLARRGLQRVREVRSFLSPYRDVAAVRGWDEGMAGLG